MTLFSNVEPVRFEGPATKSEFAFRVYDKDRLVLGKRMEDWLRPAVCYWHSFNWPGADIFGGGTLTRPWIGPTVSQEMADLKLEAAFDFFKRLGVPYFAFHDVDAMATGATLKEHDRNLKTTAIYTHVSAAALEATQSPLDRLGPPAGGRVRP